MIIHKFVFSPIEVNTYLLEENGECAIIDCGCYSNDEFQSLVKIISDKNLKPALLLNTHCHLDHIFGNKFMEETYNLRSLYHEKDEMNREMAPEHAALFGLKMDNPPLPSRYIAENEIIKFNGVELKTLFVPGHTAGGVAFYCEHEKCVFTGDALFAGSVGRSDLPGGDHDMLIRNIKDKLFSLPPDTIVYPGHGDKTDIRTEMRYNPYFQS